MRKNIHYLLTGNIRLIFLLLILINPEFYSSKEPTKTDEDVFTAIGEDFTVDESKYPYVYKWHSVMKALSSQYKFKDKNNVFRLYTPKLKFKI